MDIKSPDARSRNRRIIIIWECTVKKMQKNQNICNEIFSQIADFIKDESNLFLEL